MGPDPDRGSSPEEPVGTIRPTGHGVLAAAAALGLVVGWSVRWFVLGTGRAEPDVSWTAIALVAVTAAILGGTAWVTRRTVRADRGRLEHHHAVNRLVLGKACAVVGALLLGGYVGYGIAQLGVEDPAAATRLWRSGLAALAALAMTVAALLLELACRVPRQRP